MCYRRSGLRFCGFTTEEVSNGEKCCQKRGVHACWYVPSVFSKQSADNKQLGNMCKMQRSSTRLWTCLLLFVSIVLHQIFFELRNSHGPAPSSPSDPDLVPMAFVCFVPSFPSEMIGSIPRSSSLSFLSAPAVSNGLAILTKSLPSFGVTL